MVSNPLDPPHLEDPHAELELTLINDYLRALGHEPDALRARDDVEAHLLLADASRYASAKLTEVESRAHLVNDLHRGAGE